VPSNKDIVVDTMCCMFRSVMRTKCCSDEEIKKDEVGGRCIRGFVEMPEGNHWEDLGVGGRAVHTVFCGKAGRKPLGRPRRRWAGGAYGVLWESRKETTGKT
jgi:hypothetical protein